MRARWMYRGLGWMVALALVVVSLPQAAEARTVLGDCVDWHGTCVRPMHIQLDDQQLKDVLGQPDPGPGDSVRKNLHTGEIKIVPQAPLTRPEVDYDADDIAAMAGEDTKNLTRIERPWEHLPYRYAVKVMMRYPDNSYAMCSGSMIGRHTVLTAGHCVYNHDFRAWAEEVTITPAAGGWSLAHGMFISPYGEYTAAELSAPSAWVNQQSYSYDSAIIRLDENIGDVTGWLGLEWSQSSYSGIIYYAGYPGADGYTGNWLYREIANIAYADSGLICHYVDIVQGMSGGPAWFYFSSTGDYKVTAVNSFGAGSWQGEYFCHSRYNSQTDADRQDSESHSASSPSTVFSCGFEHFYTGDGCQCNCGGWDFDCDNNQIVVENCEISGGCEFPGVCSCTPDCAGRECGDNGCGETCGSCDGAAFYCQNGQCVEPDCDSVCGDAECGVVDGCNCGSCGGGTPYCYENQCVARDCENICGMSQCGMSGDCNCGTCPDATPTCQSGVCVGPADACSGACEGGTASFCIDDDRVCICSSGRLSITSCSDMCISQGFTGAPGCMTDNEGKAGCQCTSYCQGFMGTTGCCAPHNPCSWDNDGQCQCGGTCSWEADDCDGYVPDGDEPDGDQPDGDQPDGDQPDGDQPDGDQPDGDEPTDGDEPADGDQPTDGDQPADGDISDGSNPRVICNGPCTPGTPDTCMTNRSTLCMCIAGSWTPNACIDYCANRGLGFRACEFDIDKRRDACICADGSGEVDGDAADGDGSGATGGGCRQSSPAGLSMWLLLGLALMLRRRERTTR